MNFEFTQRVRIALYSPGMIGLGHIRRNLALAQAFSDTDLQPVILLIAESREANAFAIPKGVDCLTLPALQKDLDGKRSSRYLDIAYPELVRIRSRIIQTTMQEFMPDIFIVDHLARGAFHELDLTLEWLRKMAPTKCILGMRDIVGDPAKVQEEWRESAIFDVIRSSYDSIWVYGDSRICNFADEYDFPRDIAKKICYTGYLDKSPGLQRAIEENHDPYDSLGLPPGRLAFCQVGGGQDGAGLAEAFAQVTLPADTNGVIVTGPFMCQDAQTKLTKLVAEQPRMRILQFIGEPILLLNRADSVIAMGGYNTVCEILSFGKKSLIVPRIKRAPEQAIRAARLSRMGLLGCLPCEELTPKALTEWLSKTTGPPENIREIIDLNGLKRVRSLMMDLVATELTTGARAT